MQRKEIYITITGQIKNTRFLLKKKKKKDPGAFANLDQLGFWF